jgi:hypothetical protein
MFSGSLAKVMFESIGADLKVTRGDALDYRERHRADLSCTRYRGDYACYIGLNVVTGRRMEGSICYLTDASSARAGTTWARNTSKCCTNFATVASVVSFLFPAIPPWASRWS